MKYKTTILIAVIFLGIKLSVFAQSEEKCPCCSESYEQFDFWVGDWMVFDTLGKAIGSNSILKVQDNCVLQENWHSSNSTGTSYNYYDRNDKKWHQVWIDSNGGVLNLEGILVGNSMVLRSELQSAKTGDYYHRITWTPQEDGSVTQHWEQVNPQNVPIKTLFVGVYKKNDE